MQLGRLLTFINFALLGVAIAVYLFLPSIADLFLYILLAWMFASIVLFYLPVSQRRLGSRAAPPAAPSSASGPSPSGVPLPSGRPMPAGVPPGSGPAPIAFCIYCGTDLPTGAIMCPACGKPVRRI